MFVLALWAIVVDGSGSERGEEGIGVHDEETAGVIAIQRHVGLILDQT